VRLLARSLAPIALLSTASLFFAEAAWAAPINIAHAEMNFGATSGTNQPTVIGLRAAEGFTHRYDDIFTGVDGVVTVVDNDNLDNDDDVSDGADNLLDNFDDSSTTSGKRINLDLDVFGDSGTPGTGIGFTTFRVDFVAADTTTPVTLTNISIGVVDIDSNQYVKFAGISAYELSALVAGSPPASTATELVASETPAGSGAWEFKEPSGASSDSDDEENWVAVEYSSASSITITAGARERGSAFFGVSFADTTWPGGTPSPTRVTLTAPAYTVTYDANSADSGSVPTSQTSTVGSPSLTLTAPQGDLLRATCSFGGWNTRADGTGANYVTGDSIALTASVTLFANWTCPAASVYSLDYDDNDATAGSVPTSQASTSGSSVVLLSAPQGDLLRTSCTFDGWNSRADGTGTNYVDGRSIALVANTILYADWSCPSAGGGESASGPPTLAATGPSIAESTVVGTVAGLLVASGLAAIVAQRYVGRRDQRDVHSSA
jgi:hypothetical protein